ncbi:MAG: recombinase RecT [Sutterella wadsworthensis]
MLDALLIVLQPIPCGATNPAMGFRQSAWDDFFPTKESIMSVQTQSLIEYFATKAGIAPDKYFEALRRVPFVNCPNITREEMTGVLLLAKKLDLDPFSKEIYAIPGRNDGPVVPVIAFDGWMKILLRQPTFDGMETLPSDEMIEVDGYPRKVHAWCECVIYDKERSHPIRVREYFEEVMRPRYFRTNKGSVMLDQNSPWVRMPWRMLRAKTVIQAVRNAYPVGGFEVMSEDEVEEATAEAVAATPAPTTSSSATKKERMQAKVTRPGYATIADKAALHELLERLISHVHQKGKSVKAAHGWIIKNIALDSQPYAIDWVTAHFDGTPVEAPAPEPVPDPTPAPEPVAVEAPQAKPAENVLDDAPDADSYDLESFRDDFDIDAMS